MPSPQQAKLDLEHGWDGISVELREGMGFSELRSRTVEVNRAMMGTTGILVPVGGNSRTQEFCVAITI